MIFTSIQIQIGAVSLSAMTEKQLMFHRAIAEQTMCDATLQRKGSSYSIPVSHHEAVHDTSVLAERLLKQLRNITVPPEGVADNGIGTCVLDFCNTPYFVLREPLLLALATGIAESCKHGLCINFTLLLPKMPGTDGAFQRKIKHFDELVPNTNYIIRLISNSGEELKYERNKQPQLSTISTTTHQILLANAYGEYTGRLAKKCVRRLGHFGTRSLRDSKPKCRQYSYLMHDCGSELTQCFSDWWNTTKCDAKGIIFDLKNNDLLREVVIAHASSLEIRAERVVDVLSNNKLAELFKTIGTCVIVLDAIDSGETLERYYADLRSLDIQIANNVFAGVNKHGEKMTTLNLNLSGVLTRPRLETNSFCTQCTLRLPFMSDAGEEFVKIRSYDMHDMIKTSGWAQEPHKEVPDNIGHAYEVLPDFAKILHEHGAWLAFKLYNALLESGLPEAWFVIHPEEGDSSAFSQHLFDCVGEQLTIVRIPRQAIKKAQSDGMVSWGEIMDDNNNKYWVEQLREMRDASALILDIFNGSGSTCSSLIKLVRLCGLQPLSYACVVDFNPNKDSKAIEGISKLSLYEWYSPRVLQ